MTDNILADFFTWGSNHLGDVPTWIMAIATPVSIFIGFLIAKKQLKQTSKIEEQKFFLEVDKRLMHDDNLKISGMIYQEVYKSKTFDISDSDTQKKLSNYLSDLEYACNLYLEEIVSLDQLYTLVGLNITEVMKCESVRNYIKSEREVMHVNDLWIGVEQVSKELESISQK
ncbi:MAG: hypothetical protein KGI28_00560 [Thaumarchaeota archaeon]|nr:hypothetical protein [Nitrososphaerota archaeon]